MSVDAGAANSQKVSRATATSSSDAVHYLLIDGVLSKGRGRAVSGASLTTTTTTSSTLSSRSVALLGNVQVGGSRLQRGDITGRLGATKGGRRGELRPERPAVRLLCRRVAVSLRRRAAALLAFSL